LDSQLVFCIHRREQPIGDEKLSRRRVLGASASAAFILSAADAETLRNNFPWSPGYADRPDPADPRQGYLFFTPEEAAFIEAAISRLIPKDELGPGALEAGVAVFIDRQLAGPYGHGDHFYLKGPFPKGEDTQGWQMQSPAETYRAAILEVNRYTLDANGSVFSKLVPDQQDSVLRALESGAAQLKGGVEAKPFFTLLLQNTIEGFFADPLYGGNRDMVGWKLIGFPGARYDYRDFVNRHGESYPLPPVALGGRPEWNRS
jgi:gluconate 2-dehydrogenase gamma chain